MRAKPLASFWFDAGQWATVAPAAATSSMSSSVRWTPWPSTVPGPSRPVSRSTSIGVRPWRSRTRPSSAAVSQAWTWTRAPCSAASAPTARSWASSSRYVLCGQTQRRAGSVAARRSAAHARRSANGRSSGPGNSTNTGPWRRSKPVASATAADGLGEEVHVERRRDPGAEALGDRQRRAGGDGVVPTARRPSAGSSRDRKRSRSRSSARPRNIVIARWVWALTRPGTTIAPRASIVRRASTGPAGGPTWRDRRRRRRGPSRRGARCAPRPS